jgi:hypothetical protein
VAVDHLKPPAAPRLALPPKPNLNRSSLSLLSDDCNFFDFRPATAREACNSTITTPFCAWCTAYFRPSRTACQTHCVRTNLTTLHQLIPHITHSPLSRSIIALVYLRQAQSVPEIALPGNASSLADALNDLRLVLTFPLFYFCSARSSNDLPGLPSTVDQFPTRRGDPESLPLKFDASRERDVIIFCLGFLARPR